MATTQTPAPERVKVHHIKLDGGTQTRAGLNEETIEDYAHAMLDGVAFPPVVIFYDGSKHWLADGFHRVHAAQRAKKVEIDAFVRQGTRRDAILYSVGANGGHGLPRTNADKRRAVETLLSDPEWSQWSAHELARRACVHHTFVLRMKADVAGIGDKHQSSPEKVKTSDGREYPAQRAPAAPKAPACDAKSKPEPCAPVATPKTETKERVVHDDVDESVSLVLGAYRERAVPFLADARALLSEAKELRRNAPVSNPATALAKMAEMIGLLTKVVELADAATPVSVCPTCKGKKPFCGSRIRCGGWTSQGGSR